MNYENKWKERILEIKERLSCVPGMEHEILLQWGEVAKKDEIDLLEARLKISLPPSFRRVLENDGSSLYFTYFLTDFILPEEYSEIFSGGLSFDIEALEFLNVVTEEFLEEEDDEETKSYIKRISGMLRFADAGNGDSYVLDMSAASEEKPVLYWEHETGEITYLADSFLQYLERIGELYFIGDEMWQFESFLEDDGLNSVTPSAKRWKSWFKSLLKNRLEEKKHDLKSLFAYSLTRRKWNSELAEAFQAFSKEEVFSMIQKKLTDTRNEDVKEMLATMIVELIGTDALEWIEALWRDMGESYSKGQVGKKDVMPLEEIAYISARCMEEQKAFQMVTDYLARSIEGKITGSSACDYLKYFSAKLVIPWMEQQNIISIDGWDRLLMSVTPDWEDLLRWSEDPNRKKVVIDGLALFIQEEEGLTAPTGLPDKGIVIGVLNQMKEKELMNTRKKKIDLIIENIDLLYEK